MNLAAPVAQTYTGLSQLYLPQGARMHAQNSSMGLARFTLRITWFFAGGAAIYWVIVILLRQPIFRLVYAGRYTGTPSYSLGLLWPQFSEVRSAAQ